MRQNASLISTCVLVFVPTGGAPGRQPDQAEVAARGAPAAQAGAGKQEQAPRVSARSTCANGLCKQAAGDAPSGCHVGHDLWPFHLLS